MTQTKKKTTVDETINSSISFINHVVLYEAIDLLHNELGAINYQVFNPILPKTMANEY